MLNDNPIARMLADEQRWVIIKRLPDSRKIPIGKSQATASVSDPTTWMFLGDVIAELNQHRVGNLEETAGVALTGDILVVDFDKCLDGAFLLSFEAGMIAAKFPTYTEISMSRRGLHFFYRLEEPVNLPQKRFGAVGAEIYDAKRFISITGLGCVVDGDRVVIDRKVNEADMASVNIMDVMLMLKILGYKPPPAPPPAPPAPIAPSDSEVLRRAEEAPRSGHAFKALWRGDLQNHPSTSEADYELVKLLMLAGADDAQAERLWLASGLGQRDKTRLREDYRKRTIRAARSKVGTPKVKPDKTYEVYLTCFRNHTHTKEKHGVAAAIYHYAAKHNLNGSFNPDSVIRAYRDARGEVPPWLTVEYVKGAKRDGRAT